MYAERRDHEINMLHGGYPVSGGSSTNDEFYPISCLWCKRTSSILSRVTCRHIHFMFTFPIHVALRYFIINHQLPNKITADMVVQLPGDLKDRRTPLGELNWIFTAIIDTIAWTTLSRETFTRLYRCDLLIASLFRNFLLAERIMKNYHCTPHTYPPLPATNTHSLWATWDLAVDTCLRQLPDLLAKSLTSGSLAGPSVMSNMMGSTSPNDLNPTTTKQLADKSYVYIPSRFFTDQLTAFEVWISRGGSALTKRGPLSLPQASIELNGAQNHDSSSSERHLVPRKPPDQLPIVLQVLLSQPHRLRALILLSQFVDLGPWAVHLVLTIGIFPYISKLLQAAGQDLRPVLIFIWARILAVDSSVQTDLYNTQGYKYFSNVLGIKNEDNLPNSSEHKAMCSFILASISRDFPHGQAACWGERVFDNCYDRLDDPDFLLRQWTALCLAQMWDSNDEIKVYGVDRGTQDKLIGMLADDSAEVRAAALYALGTFMGASGSADPSKQGGGGTGTMYQLEERVHFRMEVAVATGATIAIKDDASPMCRKELLTVISCLVKEWRGYFVVCAWLYWEEDRKWRSTMGTHHPLSSSHPHDDDVTAQAVAEWLEGFGEDDPLREENRVLLSSFFTIFVVLLDLSVDPYQEVATNAQTIVDYITALLLESPFSRLDTASLNFPPTVAHDRRGSPQLSGTPPHPFLENEVERPPSRSDTIASGLSIGVAMKRTASFANSLKIFAGNIAFPMSEDGRSSPTSLSSQFRSERQGTTDLSRPPSPNMNIAQYASPYAHSQSGSTRTNTSSPRHSQEHSSNKDYMACDVMDALMEEDMERLRARRRTGSHPRRHHVVGGSLSSPSNSTFSMDSTTSSVILGLGTGVGIRDVLPLKSSFFDWCAEYFKDPQMRVCLTINTFFGFI